MTELCLKYLHRIIAEDVSFGESIFVLYHFRVVAVSIQGATKKIFITNSLNNVKQKIWNKETTNPRKTTASTINSAGNYFRSKTSRTSLGSIPQEQRNTGRTRGKTYPMATTDTKLPSSDICLNTKKATGSTKKQAQFILHNAYGTH